MRSYTFRVFVLVVLACSTATGTPPARFEHEQAHMGTQFRIVLYAPDAEAAARAADAAFARVARLDAIMSDYKETSELSRLCREAAHRPVKVSEDLFRILAASQKLAARTGGAFDVTVGPVVRLWRRARRSGELPDPERLARARELTGYEKLHLDEKGRTARLDKSGMLLDLGGIAKGYAAQEAMTVLKQHGIRSALVAAGGDIVASAPPPGARGWLVAIAALDHSEKSTTRHLLLRDRAVSTSGEAEQYVEIGGARYSHIVDPRTGLGLKGRGSVTVVAKDGMTADSLATAASVLDPTEAIKLIDATEGAAALLMRADEKGFCALASGRWKDVPKTSIPLNREH